MIFANLKSLGPEGQLKLVASKKFFENRSRPLSKRAQQNGPHLLTTTQNISAFESTTVVLPCDIMNLSPDMHVSLSQIELSVYICGESLGIQLEKQVIWQKGGRDQSNKTVLTIGRTQIENNYRVRVSPSSNLDTNQPVK